MDEVKDEMKEPTEQEAQQLKDEFLRAEKAAREKKAAEAPTEPDAEGAAKPT